MKFEEKEWIYGEQSYIIEFKTWGWAWKLVAAGKKTAEVRILTSAEANRAEKRRITHIRLVNNDTGNKLLIPLLWYACVDSMLGQDMYMFCWNPKDV